jgi:hypothetical protein
MPWSPGGSRYTSKGDVVTHDDTEGVLHVLESVPWGVKGAYQRKQSHKLGLPHQTSNTRDPKNQCLLPPHPLSDRSTRTTSTGTATTIVLKPPQSFELAADDTAEVEGSSVVVRRPHALASAPSASCAASSLSSLASVVTPAGAEDVGEDEAVKNAKATTVAVGLSDSFLQQNPSNADISSSNSNSSIATMTTTSSVSDSTAYTRMRSAHPNNFMRHIARTNLFAYQRRFVPTTFSAGIRPMKQCLSPVAGF